MRGFLNSASGEVLNYAAYEGMWFARYEQAEDMANANLIAAAPELLGVARDFVRLFADFERWPQGKGYSMTPDALALYATARAAIAKAEGT